MEPGVEPLGITQPRQVVPGPDQGLLDRIAGEIRIPEDEAGGPVQPRDGPMSQLGEGVMIALPRSLDESSLVHDRLDFGTPWVDVLDRVWRSNARFGSSKWQPSGVRRPEGGDPSGALSSHPLGDPSGLSRFGDRPDDCAGSFQRDDPQAEFGRLTVLGHVNYMACHGPSEGLCESLEPE